MTTAANHRAAYVITQPSNFRSTRGTRVRKSERLGGKVQAAGKQLHKMISDEIILALSDPNATGASVAFAAGDPEATNTPFASFFTLNGLPSLAVAYVILQGERSFPTRRST